MVACISKMKYLGPYDVEYLKQGTTACRALHEFHVLLYTGGKHVTPFDSDIYFENCLRTCVVELFVFKQGIIVCRACM
jgi:hypothetical protein